MGRGDDSRCPGPARTAPAPGEAPPIRRRFVVGVMGSGSSLHQQRAAPLGRWLAELGVHLLTGGGGGVMASVSRAFFDTPDRAGVVIGILPGDESGMARGPYPNPWVEIAIRTHLPLSGERGTEPMSRNHINILSADVIVALPGGPGTASEIRLARRYGQPLAAFVAAREEIPGLPDHVPVLPELDRVQSFVTKCLGIDDSGRA